MRVDSCLCIVYNVFVPQGVKILIELKRVETNMSRLIYLMSRLLFVLITTDSVCGAKKDLPAYGGKIFFAFTFRLSVLRRIRRLRMREKGNG